MLLVGALFCSTCGGFTMNKNANMNSQRVLTRLLSTKEETQAARDKKMFGGVARSLGIRDEQDSFDELREFEGMSVIGRHKQPTGPS